MASDYGKSLYNDYETLLLKYEKIAEENKILKKEHACLSRKGGSGRDWKRNFLAKNRKSKH